MKLCFIATGLTQRTCRLQPWHYLVETAHCLQSMGHAVDLISTPEREGHAGDQVAGIAVHRVADVRVTRLRRNAPLENTIASVRPDWLIWHVGLTSFLHLDLVGRFAIPSVGVFTSPIYTPAEVFRPGLRALLAERELSLAHLAGLCMSSRALRRQVRPAGLRHLVTLSETTRRALLRRGLAPDQVTAIRPGLDPGWLERLTTDVVAAARAELGFMSGDVVVAYAGAPVRLRGIDTLIRAFSQARYEVPSLKLLVLSRRHADELAQAERRARGLISSLGLEASVRLVSGFLERRQVQRYLAAADIVALPFHLVPSDMPVSLLEASALGKPVVTTDTACLPELVPLGCGLRVPPAQVGPLACALKQFAADPQLRRRAGEQARGYVERWDGWEQAQGRWAQLWQRQC